MSTKSTDMQQQLLHNLFDQLIQQQLRTYTCQQQLFYYTDILMNVWRKIQLICNNSPIALEQFYVYVSSRLVYYTMEIPVSPEHVLLHRLNIEAKYVVYFTQICYRMILLGCLCKLGDESKQKQWRRCMDQLIKQCRLQFMFNYHDSLATAFVTFINNIEGNFNQFTYYEKLIALFNKHDMEYVAEDIQQKQAKAKQNWKTAVNKNKQEFHNMAEQQANKKVEDSAVTQKLKKARKSVKIVCEADKPTPSQNLTKRISDFREKQRKRLSEHKQSGKKRTLFYSRKYTVKQTPSKKSYEQQQIYMEQNQQAEENPQPYSPQQRKMMIEKAGSIRNHKRQQIVKPNIKHNKLFEIKAYEQQNFSGDDEGFLAPGTPPKKSKHNNHTKF